MAAIFQIGLFCACLSSLSAVIIESQLDCVTVSIYEINRIIRGRIGKVEFIFSCSIWSNQIEHSKINPTSPRAHVLFSIYFSSNKVVSSLIELNTTYVHFSLIDMF